jgi:hypothetical protein
MPLFIEVILEGLQAIAILVKIRVSQEVETEM